LHQNEMLECYLDKKTGIFGRKNINISYEYIFCINADIIKIM